MTSRPLRIAASATTTLAVVAAGLATTASVAGAAPDVDTTLCTDAPGLPDGVQPVWTGSLTEGQAVHGLTTTHGIAPEPFTGTYVSRLKDGAGRGKDILLFRMEGSRITKQTAGGDTVVDAGIWAGMSGSPVYDDDGNLVGSVSYGFSGSPSTLAGVTPAKDVLDVQSSPAAAPAARIAVPRSVGQAVAQSTVDRTDSAADHADIQPLALPRVSVGTPGKQTTKFAAKSRYFADKAPGSSLKFATASTATDLDPTEAIVPGGNIATSFSHGDVALAAVGTVTAVCGTKVFAFGHPDEFDGNKSTETFHAAEAAEIQEDSSFFGSFKLANIDMDPVGQITQDRLSGIMGVTGQLPFETTVTTNTTVGGDSTSATTEVSNPAAVSTVLQGQMFNDVIDGLDAYAGGGEAISTWTVDYTPQGGVPATYTRTQRTSARSYLAEQVGYDAASDLELLQFGSDQKVKITSVTVDTELKPDYNALRLSKVEIRKSGAWTKVKNGQRITAKKASTYPMRVTLTPTNADSVATTVVTRLDTKIPTSRGQGVLEIAGAADYYGDEDLLTIDYEDEGSEGYEDEEYFYYGEEPLTLAEVLEALSSQPRNDSVLSNQHWQTSKGTSQVVRRSASSPAVTTGQYYLRLVYKK